MPNSTSTCISKTLDNQVLGSHAQIQAAIHQFFRALTIDDKYAVMLGGTLLKSKLNQKILLARKPRHILRLKDGGIEYENIKENTLQKFSLQNPNNLLPYLRQQAWTQHSFFFASYEFYRYCDPAFQETFTNRSHSSSPSTSDDPDLLLIDFEEVFQFDCEQLTWNWGSIKPERQEQIKLLWSKCLDSQTSTENKILSKNHAPESYTKQFNASFSKESFESAVNQIHQHIQQGDLYQANLSLCLKKEVTIPCPYQLYEALCNQNPSPFSAFLKTPESILISNSPERLLAGSLKSDEELILETRPIAGTRGRGSDETSDQQIAESLLNNEKERAEHLMLVDLLRNDLGKVCLAGSVIVDECLSLERYSHVMHLVSNVIGIKQEEKNIWDILSAVFPGGTITGCPKIRCIQILEALEPVPRGFYTGSLGYINTDKENLWGNNALDWNILIRTLKLTPLPLQPLTSPALSSTFPYNGKLDASSYKARLHVGAGIVADSIAAHEYRECYRKAEALLGALYDAEQSFH